MEEQDLQLQLNKLKEYAYDYTTNYANLFINGLYSRGIIRDITPEQLQQYFACPDVNQDIIGEIAEYFYIINAEIHQLFELIESLPKLNYTINTFEREGSQDKNIIKLKKAMHRIEHKRLTRDIMKQTAGYGNVLGVFLGKGMDTYPYIFNDLCYVSNAFRTVRGKWQIILSASFFYDKPDYERDALMLAFKDLMSKQEYDLLRRNELVSFKLPIERTIFTGTGRLNRNQFIGTSWVTPVMLDVLHKRKLKDVEQTIANKIINAVAVLTMGSFDGEEKDNKGNLVRDFNNIPTKLVKAIHADVKKALSAGDTEGMALVTIPNFAELVFPKLDSDGLDPEKFNQSNSDITKGLGISTTLMNGEGANYNSAKLNLDIFYTRLGVMLEDMEYVYQLFFDLVLPKQYEHNYYLVYSKDAPLPIKERIQHLKGLYDKGWSARTYIEELGYDFDSMWAETKEELNMGISASLQPPPTSYTLSSETVITENGRPPVGDGETESENTVRTRETQGSA